MISSHPPPDDSILVPGSRLGGYELLFPLSSGGMGAVWAARLQSAPGIEKLYAVKVILPRYADDVKFRQMFLDEARIAAAVEHPNVARIFDLGEQRGTLYLVMEYVLGDSLMRLHRSIAKQDRLPFSLPIALRIVADAAAGLHAAHELCDPKREGVPLDVVHRDISPQNILIDTSGVVKIIDFGIAKARGRMVGETTTGVVKGKVHFMPPEQAFGGEVDRRTDIFALGAVLYFIVSGTTPYEGENDIAILHALLNEDMPPALGDEVAEPVRAVIMRAIAHDPDNRFATADEFRAAIEDAMARCNLVATCQDVASFASSFMSEIRETHRKALQSAHRAIQRQRAMQELVAPSASLEAPRSADAATGEISTGSDVIDKRDVPTTALRFRGNSHDHKTPERKAGELPSTSGTAAGLARGVRTGRSHAVGFVSGSLVAALVAAVLVWSVVARPVGQGLTSGHPTAAPNDELTLAAQSRSAPASQPAAVDSASAPPADRPTTSAAPPASAPPSQPSGVRRPAQPPPSAHRPDTAPTTTTTSRPRDPPIQGFDMPLKPL